MVMIVSSAFANRFSIKIIYLASICLLVYACAGVHNAIKDKDYLLPSYSKFIVFSLLIISAIISLQDIVIFFTAILWILLGLIYNTAARHILFGDATILSITHFALPSLSTSLLLDVELKFALFLSGFMFFTFWFIMHSKNLKDAKEDKQREYKTLVTMFKNGRYFTLILLDISFILMFISYFLFDLSIKYLLILVIVSILNLVVINRMVNSEAGQAVKLIRLIMLIFLFGLIFDKASNDIVVLFSLFLVFISALFLIPDVINITKKRFVDIAGQ